MFLNFLQFASKLLCGFYLLRISGWDLLLSVYLEQKNSDIALGLSDQSVIAVQLHPLCFLYKATWY